MNRQPEPGDSATAINTALQAEQDALQAVAAAQTQAQLLLEQARSRAQHIVDRTDARIARVHARCSRRVMERVHALRRQEAGLSANKPWGELREEQVNEVIEQVAAALIMDTPDGPAR